MPLSLQNSTIACYRYFNHANDNLLCEKAWIDRFHVTSPLSKIQKVFILMRYKRRYIYICLNFYSSIACFVWKPEHFEFHTELCKFLRNISTNICGLGERTALKLGEVSSLFIFYRVTISWLYPLNGFRFIFLLRDSENDLYYCIETTAPPEVALLAASSPIRKNRKMLVRTSQRTVYDENRRVRMGERSHELV